MKPTRIILGLAGCVWFYLDHKNFVHYLAGKQTLEGIPTIEQVKPNFEVPKNNDFESKVDKEIKEIEDLLPKLQRKYISEKTTFTGPTMIDMHGEVVPNGVGQLDEFDKKRKTISTWLKGNLSGPTKIQTKINDKERIEKYIYDNGVKGDYFVTYYEDGRRCEGSLTCYKCTFPDDSFLLERVDKNNNKLESYYYDKEGYLRIKKDLKYPSLAGSGVWYFEDGRKYEGEMVDGDPHGIGRIQDRYGDIIYEGEFENGDFPIWNSAIIRSAGILMCFMGSLFL